MLGIMLPGRAVVAVAGEDARGLLQGLVSNDVERLRASRAIHAALLTPQGKWLADFVMLDAGEALLLDIETVLAADLVRRLTMYRLRAKAEIGLREGVAVAVALGPEAPAAFGLPAEPGAARRDGAIVMAVDPRAAALGVRLVGPEAELCRALAAVGAQPAGREAWDAVRIPLAVPDGSRDLVAERSTLLESNFDVLNGVSFEKGCFVGQELTARMRYRGLVRKRLVPVRVEGAAPPPGTPVITDDREVGELRGSAGGWGLALLRLDRLAGAPALAAGDAGLVPAPPAWMREGA
jgi:hypothetical protein